MIDKGWQFGPNFRSRKIMELGFSFMVGAFLGLLIMLVPKLPIPEDFQKLVYFVPFLLLLVVLVNNLERLILVAIAIGVPLNLDYSIAISPYARNFENLSRGYRTLIATTELRVSFVTIALIVGYFLWVFAPENRGERTRVRLLTTVTGPALLYILFTVLSVINAQDVQLWFFRTTQLVEVFFVYFYLINHVRNVKDLEFFITVLLVGLMIEGVLMVIQWITGLTFFFAGIQAIVLGPGRVAGTLGHTGPAAGYVSALSIVAMGLIWGFTKLNQKRLAVTSAGFGIIALLSTGSRIGFGGFAVTLVVFLLTCLKLGWIKRETIILLIVIMSVVFVASFGIITSRFSSDLQDASAQSRPMMWKLAWRTILANPWIGVGAGNYALITRDYYTSDIGPAGEVYDKIVHNAYLGIWAESGLFALLSYLAMLASATLSAWSVWRSKFRFQSLLGIGLALAIVSMGIQMITGTFYMRSITLFLWILIALAACVRNIDLSTSNHRDLIRAN